MGLLQAGDVCGSARQSECVVPSYSDVLLIMGLEAAVYWTLAVAIDMQNLSPLEEKTYEPSLAETTALHQDVLKERDEVLQSGVLRDGEPAYSLRIAGLRKLFPPKRMGNPPLQAVKSLSVGLARGEVFGLL
jgi:hypothetical protein